MLISTTEELRLYSPANAIDHIDTIQGYIASSEQDMLLEKLGTPLYKAMVNYYRQMRSNDSGIATFVRAVTDGEDMPPYAVLLSLCQRIITFDALGRAIDMQAVSVNGSGVNISTADDYGKADREAIQSYKSTCVKETHAAINALLVILEQWTKETATLPAPSTSPAGESATVPEGSPSGDDTVPAGSASGNETPEEETPALSGSPTEKKEIADHWRSSRYFYLAASLIIPSATILQEYLNIYDSREKYIQMLPDLRYIQEDIIAPIIGEDFLDYMVSLAISGFPTEISDMEKTLLSRIIHKLRKAVARHLESRILQQKTTDPRREQARNEAVRLTTDLSEYLQAHQNDLPESAKNTFRLSPLYTPEEGTTANYQPEFQNNSDGAVMFVTDAIPQ